jgi:hypothetical protein
MSGVRSITRRPALGGGGTASAQSCPIRCDDSANVLKYVPTGSGTTEIALVDVSTAQVLTSKTLTTPVINSVPVVVAAATHTPGPTVSGQTIVLTDLAGGVVTLPAATGTGNIYKYVIGVAPTSVSWTFAVASGTDFLRGALYVGTDDADSVGVTFVTANTGTVATESDTIIWNRSTTGVASIGDNVTFQDIASAVWSVTGFMSTTGAEATCFSAAV